MNSLNNQWDRKKTNPGWELLSLWNLHSRPVRPKADNLAPLNLDFWSTETETSLCVVLNRCICGHLLSCTAEWMQLWHALARNNPRVPPPLTEHTLTSFSHSRAHVNVRGLGWDVATQILQKHSANIWSLDPSDARGWGLRSAARQLLWASAERDTCSPRAGTSHRAPPHYKVASRHERAAGVFSLPSRFALETWGDFYFSDLMRNAMSIPLNGQAHCRSERTRKLVSVTQVTEFGCELSFVSLWSTCCSCYHILPLPQHKGSFRDHWRVSVWSRK